MFQFNHHSQWYYVKAIRIRRRKNLQNYHSTLINPTKALYNTGEKKSKTITANK